MTIPFDATLAKAVTQRLRARLPWWYRFKIEVEPQAANVRHRTLRPPFTSGRSSWSGFDDASEELELVLENVLLSIQSDIWNTVHRCWPVRNGRVGAACSFEDLPSPEVRVEGEMIQLWFGGHDGALALPPIRLDELHG